LLRYLQARTGRAVNIYPLERLPASAHCATSTADTVYCDGVNLYLPSQISTAATLANNEALYWFLARLECGTIEFDSFGFDLNKLCQKYPRLARWRDRAATTSRVSDLQQFLATFPNPDFASDLFTIYEHGRLRLLTAQHYPGLSRRLAVALNKLEGVWAKGRGSDDLRSQLYRAIALGEDQGLVPGLVTHLYHRFEAHISIQATAEDSGALVADTYASVVAELVTQGIDIDHLPPMVTPYGRRIDADLHAAVHGDRLALARKITDLLTRAGIDCYCSDVQRTLQLEGPEHLIDGKVITGKDDPGQNETAPVVDAATVDALRQLITAHGHRFKCGAEAAGADAVWYPEWDHHLNGYLHCHAAVHERSLKGRDESLAAHVQQRHAGLIRATRYAFEMMRPQGLAILRQWIEGDDFDYRALMDYAVERKAGHNPSERVYIKRLKNERSVAVLLLVDLSRSTANIAVDGRQSVIDVEKEAIYIFCCALSILGDEFGVAGFSGNGRLQLDYSVMKDFEEDFDPPAIARIGAIAPQRNTRMGAAIRHATAQLCQRPTKVPLLIILGDGFPNDVDYKQGYALADTRKALAEACAKGVFTHGITVNMAADPKLDDLYGDSLHTVISDVRELPNRLVRIYSALTRR
jgi:hypothetical protein